MGEDHHLSDVQVESFEGTTPESVDSLPTAAGGVASVVSALSHVFTAMPPGRAIRVLTKANQVDGFDCPGCAWPDPEEPRSFAEFCENGAKAIAEAATSERAGADLFKRWSVAELSHQSDLWLGQQGRLTEPMVRRTGASHYTPISWDDAFDLVASELRAQSSPDEAVFYTSGRTSNEAAFLYQLLVRQFGTNNLPDCSNLCHESSGVALTEAIGVAKGTVSLPDFEQADLIMVIGQNPGTCHPRMLSTLERAVQKGARIISVNPLPEVGLARFKQPQDLKNPLRAARMLAGGGTRLAELHVPVRVNGDVAFLKGVMKTLFQEERRTPGSALARDFIAEKTTGFAAFAAALAGVTWPSIERASGVPRELIEQVGRVVAASERIIVTWAMGLTQHRNAVGNIQEIVNLLLLRGSFGKPGAGACPVRGHSNVQGDRTMGIWENPRPEFLDRLEATFGFSAPRRRGLDTVGAIRAMAAGKVRVFVAMGGNFLSASPDTRATAEALARCRLTVQISTKLNRSHLVTGAQALILPCLARTDRLTTTRGEQFYTVENSMGIVHASRGTVDPPPDLPSEPMIVAELARRILGDQALPWSDLAADLDEVRNLIERVVPGFERFNARIRGAGGFQLPNVVREGGFGTVDGRARFTIHDLPEDELGPDELLLMTIRSHDQFNTSIYGLDDRYRGIRGGRRVVFLNRDDLKDRGLVANQLVDICGRPDPEQRIARSFRVVEYAIPRGCAAAYFPEANILVPLSAVAERSNTPASKSIAITIRPSQSH